MQSIHVNFQRWLDDTTVSQPILKASHDLFYDIYEGVCRDAYFVLLFVWNFRVRSESRYDVVLGLSGINLRILEDFFFQSFANLHLIGIFVGHADS